IYGRFGSYGIDQFFHMQRYTGGVARGGPVSSSNLMQNCIFSTQLAAWNGARCRPFFYLIGCQDLSNSSQWNLLLNHSFFTSVQIPVDGHKGEFHSTTPHIDFVVINVSMLTHLWSNIDDELLHQNFHSIFQ